MRKKYKIILAICILVGLALGYVSFENNFGWNLDPPYEIMSFLANSLYWTVAFIIIASLLMEAFIKLRFLLKKFSRGFKIVIGIILLPIVFTIIFIGLIRLLDITSYNKYEQKDFQSYEKTYIYCGMFWGGTSESREEIYKLWKKDELIGC